MEQIVYCQDQAYRAALQTIREKEAEKRGPSDKHSPPQPDSLACSLAEILQHLKAYRQVSLRASPKGAFLSP